MNQTFSVARFGRLLRKYFTDNRGQLLADAVLIIGCLFLASVFAYQGLPGSVMDLRTLLFFLFGWTGWYVFTVQQMSVLNQKERGMNYLMQPASQFEKIGIIWLVSGVGFVLVFGLVFTALDSAGVWVVNHRNWSPEQVALIKRQGGLFTIKPFFADNHLGNVPTQLWAFSALLHAFTMVFTLLIRRNTLPLVAVTAFALLIFSYLGNNFLLHTLTGSGWISSVSPFAQATAQSPVNQYDYRAIALPQPISNQLRYAVGIIAVILLYSTAYVRLKEREV
jgi:hypothetical protein